MFKALLISTPSVYHLHKLVDTCFGETEYISGGANISSFLTVLSLAKFYKSKHLLLNRPLYTHYSCMNSYWNIMELLNIHRSYFVEYNDRPTAGIIQALYFKYKADKELETQTANTVLKING